MKKKIAPKKIYYTAGWKYILEKEWHCPTEICPPRAIRFKNIRLSTKGLLILTPGFPWDGPSGPTIDTPNSIAASASHDALYRLMRQGLLSRQLRILADRIFYRILIEKKMSDFRATAWYIGVRKLAKYATLAKNKKRVRIAP